MAKSEIIFRDDFDVRFIDSMGSDARICEAAWASTKGADAFEAGESEGLINFLMENRHGSPFEHVIFQWLITCPIFVWREFMRHRIASYNEQSGRYMQLEPVFYIPRRDRPLIQVGKPGHYDYVPGDGYQHEKLVRIFQAGATRQYRDYEQLLETEIAKEVARMELPLNIYSTAMVTMNARGLMNFLSLRTKSDDATYKSFPQYEINQVADLMEKDFEKVTPHTAVAFTKHGRVQP